MRKIIKNVNLCKVTERQLFDHIHVCMWCDVIPEEVEEVSVLHIHTFRTCLCTEAEVGLVIAWLLTWC